MIVTELYNGQGLGNQLWCYAVTRSIALKRNFDFGIMGTHKFKGCEFLDLDFGLDIRGGHGPEGGPPVKLPNHITHYYKEKKTIHPQTRWGISKKDDKLFGIKDNTKIDGVMQSIDYIKDNRTLLRAWIHPRADKNILTYNDENVCVIHIRGGDFHGSSALLDKTYYDRAMNKMLNMNSSMKFYIVTDDVKYSHYLYPHLEIVGGSSNLFNKDKYNASHHSGGPVWMDWVILNNCKNAIISASSFSWWPIWLNDNVNVIAPMYWAVYKQSDGYWSCGDSLIEGWLYLNRNGEFYDYVKCAALKAEYEKQNAHFWAHEG